MSYVPRCHCWQVRHVRPACLPEPSPNPSQQPPLRHPGRRERGGTANLIANTHQIQLLDFFTHSDARFPSASHAFSNLDAKEESMRAQTKAKKSPERGSSQKKMLSSKGSLSRDCKGPESKTFQTPDSKTASIRQIMP